MAKPLVGFLQGVSGIVSLLSSSGLRLTFETRPVDMKAPAHGLAALKGVTVSFSSCMKSGREEP